MVGNPSSSARTGRAWGRLTLQVGLLSLSPSLSRWGNEDTGGHLAPDALWTGSHGVVQAGLEITVSSDCLECIAILLLQPPEQLGLKLTMRSSKVLPK